MKKLSTLIFSATAGLLVSTASNAEVFDVTATISNAITLTETTPFSLGSMYIVKGDGTPEAVSLTPDADSAAQVVIDPVNGAGNPSAAGATDANSKIVMLGGDQPGVLSIAGAAAFADITITVGTITPGTDNLVHSSGNPALPPINILAISAEADDADGGTTLTLDANGAGNIFIGGTFGAADYATYTGTYADGTYTGSYDITVAY